MEKALFAIRNEMRALIMNGEAIDHRLGAGALGFGASNSKSPSLAFPVPVLPAPAESPPPPLVLSFLMAAAAADFFAEANEFFSVMQIACLAPRYLSPTSTPFR